MEVISAQDGTATIQFTEHEMNDLYNLCTLDNEKVTVNTLRRHLAFLTGRE